MPWSGLSGIDPDSLKVRAEALAALYPPEIAAALSRPQPGTFELPAPVKLRPAARIQTGFFSSVCCLPACLCCLNGDTAMTFVVTENSSAVHRLRRGLPGRLLPRRPELPGHRSRRECIDCTLCEPECPAEAIFAEDDLPAGQEHFIQLNADLARDWPVIAEQKDPLPDAQDWDGKPGKLGGSSADPPPARPYSEPVDRSQTRR